ncbi:MAG: hypothetical protein SFY81_11060 [Verrucomicrobiota bacterium]|nr:hypothetical protein [Verrucomicrobiota bacterium]
MNTPEFRRQTAAILRQSFEKASAFRAFVGLDGFVDEIIHAVGTRQSFDQYERLPTLTSMGDRIREAAGRSTNIELVNQRTKLGGNGPIMANALASFGLKVTYLGALGYPQIHPVFQQFAQKAELFSIADSGHTDAIEFEDGKLMLVKSSPLDQITWANIQTRFGREPFQNYFSRADLVGFVNWTMIPFMSDFWESLQTELCPLLTGPRRKIFFDLADPQKRPATDIARALNLITGFQEYFDVILGLNEKEAFEVGEVMGLHQKSNDRQALSELAREIYCRLKIDTLVVHPVTYALAVTDGTVSLIDGPKILRPFITTGAGDHFNSGFCLGKLLGLSNSESLLCGVTTSGYYVRSGISPGMDEIAGMMLDWPV